MDVPKILKTALRFEGCLTLMSTKKSIMLKILIRIKAREAESTKERIITTDNAVLVD